MPQNIKIGDAMSTIKCVGILTSGGDAPGMNAAIRAVTRSAIYNGMKVKGIYRGYKGLLLDEVEEFKTQNEIGRASCRERVSSPV